MADAMTTIHDKSTSLFPIQQGFPSKPNSLILILAQMNGLQESNMMRLVYPTVQVMDSLEFLDLVY